MNGGRGYSPLDLGNQAYLAATFAFDENTQILVQILPWKALDVSWLKPGTFVQKYVFPELFVSGSLIHEEFGAHSMPIYCLRR